MCAPRRRCTARDAGPSRNVALFTDDAQTARYVAGGADEETFEPRFTYYGFRYLTIRGLAEAPKKDDFVGCFVRTAFPTTGRFTCSSDDFNRLMDAAARSFEGNFTVGFPTDCPHREKNGWTADAAMAVDFGLAPAAERAAAEARLVRAVGEADGHFTFGLVGSRHLLGALSKVGRTDLVVGGLLQKTAPSFLAWLNDGGGTLWETYDGAASRNHIMFGYYAAWAYEHLAGVTPLAPGYSRIRFAPEPIAALTNVAASVATPHGEVRASWRREADGAIVYEFDVPAGATAVLELKGSGTEEVGPGHHVRRVVLPRIVFDADMIGDYDDVGALAILHALADAGECEIASAAGSPTSTCIAGRSGSSTRRGATTGSTIPPRRAAASPIASRSLPSARSSTASWAARPRISPLDSPYVSDVESWTIPVDAST